MTGLGARGNPTVLIFTGQVVEYSAADTAEVSGLYGTVSVQVPEESREHFRVDTPCLISVVAIQPKPGKPTRDAA